MVRPETQKILWNKLGLTPARKSVFPQLASNGFPLEVLENVLDSAVPRPVTAMYNPISQSMQAYISGALVGAYSIDQAVRLIDSDVKRIMRVLDG